MMGNKSLTSFQNYFNIEGKEEQYTEKPVPMSQIVGES
jgi:hypothetical protein